MGATLSRKLSLALRHSELGWRYAFNLAPSVGYRMSRRELPAEGRRVIGDLNEKGIAITTAEALLGGGFRNASAHGLCEINQNRV